jgi:hypothetical protein
MVVVMTSDLDSSVLDVAPGGSLRVDSVIRSASRWYFLVNATICLVVGQFEIYGVGEFEITRDCCCWGSYAF